MNAPEEMNFYGRREMIRINMIITQLELPEFPIL